jgi:hypothetical protein
VQHGKDDQGQPNESTTTDVYLYQTWARPDMIYPHTNTITDPVTGAILPGSGAATLWEPSLDAMTTDLHNAYFGLAASNPDFKAVAPVGDAFLRAVQNGKATGNPYAANALTDGLIDLWWDDNLHASKYGSYLSALTLFGTITGRDPQSIGMYDLAARTSASASTTPTCCSRSPPGSSGLPWYRSPHRWRSCPLAFWALQSADAGARSRWASRKESADP